MISVGKYPEGMSVDEVNEYLKMFMSLHPFERSGTLNIELDGDFVDLYLNTDQKIPFQRVRRITGYLVGTVDKWNNAKRSELEDRVKHFIESNEQKQKEQAKT